MEDVIEQGSALTQEMVQRVVIAFLIWWKYQENLPAAVRVGGMSIG
jgi:hypothetical protein